MAKNYARGDELTVGGQKAVVTNTGFNNGNPEYTITFPQEDGRPVSVGQLVDPQAFTNGQPELLKVNAEKQAETNAEAEKATQEAEKNADAAEDKAVEDSGDKSLSDETKSKPADSKTPVTNSVPATKAAGTTPASKK